MPSAVAPSASRLRQEYILGHPEVPARILDGTEPLPAGWVARRLAELDSHG